MNKMIIKSAPAYKVEIFIGCDDLNMAFRLCEEFCTQVGLCVTVSPSMYCYSDGHCDGIVVGLINYARFPKKHDQIWETALRLAGYLKTELNQGSFTVQDHERSYFYSTRDEDQ